MKKPWVMSIALSIQVKIAMVLNVTIAILAMAKIKGFITNYFLTLFRGKVIPNLERDYRLIGLIFFL